jgi:hypothetical protein
MPKKLLILLLAFILLYFLLMIPESESEIQTIASESPFEWNQDEYWEQLELNFQNAQKLSPEELESNITDYINKANLLFDPLIQAKILAGDQRLFELEENFFTLAPLIAANQDSIQWFIEYYNSVRNTVKRHSQNWDMNTMEARNTVYSMLYGMRATVEEVLLQMKKMENLGTMRVNSIESPSPSTEIFGMKVHSGDLLLSRGGAEVSALISRGNDYPGNFSHVALIYIDEENASPYIIEAHIEKGVAITNLEGYLKDKKLRVMVLRVRPDLAEMGQDPMLPHKAAKFMYEETLSRHIPYDFKMDFHDSDAMFCSEVGSYAYKQLGVTLWQSVSTISSQGIVNWMHSFGVENFVTQLPSDLEYDPQLLIIGEWRDQKTLFKDHVDNAIVDVMLEQANDGIEIEINPFQLPLARILKAYCVGLNQFGKVGVIPEGMSATTALRNNAFVEKFQDIKINTEPLIDEFITVNKYRPPYWKLVSIATESTQIIEN